MASFERAQNMKGFDRWAAPRWQMVPVSGQRYMYLRDGAGLTVTSTNTAVATVSEIARADLPTGPLCQQRPGDRFFKIGGAAWGIARIQAKRGGVLVTELEVDIKNKKTVKLGFNFVRDNAGHQTNRALASAAAWLAQINYIYEGQANVTFRQQCARSVTVAQNLGSVVRFSSHLPGVPAAQHEWNLVTALGDPAADMNIFFVWEYEQDNTPFSDNTDAGTLSNNCLFEDRAGRQVGETLAHEIGHYLGCDDHYIVARKRELMYGITDARGVHLPKEDSNIMNP